MPYFNIVAESNKNTVVTEYEPVKTRSDQYQSEAALEQEFIRLLADQGYAYLPIHKEGDLVSNIRAQLEELNHYQFTDSEWERFFSDAIANPNEHIKEKTRKIQEDNVQVLKRDDGSSKNITIIDKCNIHNNRLQVINQYKVNAAKGSREGGLGRVIGTDQGANHDNRYDVTILVNGLPLAARDFLDSAINDYNLMFHTNYDTSSDKFQNYYKDVSLRMKNKELDMLIVVNMFLTGFDATIER